MMDITHIAMSTSYLDIHLEIDSEGWLRTKNYDRYDFNFQLTVYMYSNIPSAPAKKSNTTGATSGVGTAYPSGVLHRFLVEFVLLNLVICVVFYRSLLYLSIFGHCIDCCMSSSIHDFWLNPFAIFKLS